MVVVLARLRLRPDRADEGAAALRDFVEYVRREEPGTLTYVVHRKRDEPRELIVYERYADQASFQEHTNSARFAEMFSVLGPMLDGEPVIELWEEVAGKGV